MVYLDLWKVEERKRHKQKSQFHLWHLPNHLPSHPCLGVCLWESWAQDTEMLAKSLMALNSSKLFIPLRTEFCEFPVRWAETYLQYFLCKNDE
jgi:3-hydroxymyristoyl/3-hydroxydecanoyl-(acyl carrier protein) dehydratase